MDSDKIFVIVFGLCVIVGIIFSGTNDRAKIDAETLKAKTCIENRMSWIPVPSDASRYQCVVKSAE